MDALSDMLRVVGLTGAVFLEARFTAPWCVMGQVSPSACAPYMRPPPLVMAFHFVMDGDCIVAVDGETPCTVEHGDMILLPRNQMHRFGSRTDGPAVHVGEIMRPAGGTGLLRVEHGGGGAPCNMVCGFLGGDVQLEPLIATLPPVLKLSARDTPGGAWMAQSFRFGARELAHGDPGAATIMSKMSELLFVEAVRRYLTAMPDGRTGFLAGLRDPAVGKALALLHTQVARAWTAEDLAAEVNLSRSAFAERFAALMEQPPMRYLTWWRMQVAAQKLREGRLSIGQIAVDIGYESEASFTRAFKRETGVPPATWRRQATGAGATG